jgi:hypothetical protein
VGSSTTRTMRVKCCAPAEIVTAAKASHQPTQDEATKPWFANADQIAAFLSDANPKNWPQAEMQKMMRDHLTVRPREVVAGLQGNWATDIAAFDKVHEQILHISDLLSAGILINMRLSSSNRSALNYGVFLREMIGVPTQRS